MTEEEIHKLCEKYNIENYKINSDMTIDVNENIVLPVIRSKTLPIKFGKVSGYFHYGTSTTTQINNFDGCPNYVEKYFNCGVVKSPSLKGCSKYVGGGFYCGNLRLTSLDGLPVDFYIGGDFVCNTNNIKSAKEFGKLLFGYIGGDITTQYSDLDAFLNKNKNPSKRDLPRILSELRKLDS